VKRFILSSTVGIYGNHPDTDYCTEETPPDPLSPYSQSKLAAEQKLAELADRDFTPVYLRNATVFGWSPRVRFDSPINSFIYTAITKGKIVLKTNGLAWRPIIHIRDLVRAFMLVLNVPKEIVHNQIFNVGSTEDNFRLIDIVSVVQSLFPNMQLEVEGKEAGSSFKVDFSKLERTFNFKRTWSLRRGYQEVIEHSAEITGVDQDYSNYRAMLFLLSQKEIDDYYFWLRQD
jgi:nucleoside-diphosphate-sugar epimerase